MKGFPSLSIGDRGKTLLIGEFVTLEVLVEGNELSQAQNLRFADFEGRWMTSGSFTIDTSSLQLSSADGNNSKISFRAMVHQPNEMFLSSLKITTNVGEVITEPTQLSGKVALPEGAEKEEVQWFTDTKEVGDWNYLLLTILFISLATPLLFFLRFLYRKLWKKKELDYRTRTVQSLQNLQKFSRAKTGLKQEEWKKFSFELASVMRRYCDEHFQFESADLTDREFLRELKFRASNDAAVESLAKILSTIDEVRYGKKELDLQTVPQLILESRRFVDQTFERSSQKSQGDTQGDTGSQGEKTFPGGKT